MVRCKAAAEKTVETDTQAVVEELLETVFSVRSMPCLDFIEGTNGDHRSYPHVEAGSNTSTVTL
jgi:hypothetical protein